MSPHPPDEARHNVPATSAADAHEVHYPRERLASVSRLVVFSTLLVLVSLALMANAILGIYPAVGVGFGTASVTLLVGMVLSWKARYRAKALGLRGGAVARLAFFLGLLVPVLIVVAIAGFLFLLLSGGWSFG